MPNFTQIGQEFLKLRAEILLCSCHCADSHGTYGWPATLCEYLPTDFHENPTNGLVANMRSKKGRQTDMVLA